MGRVLELGCGSGNNLSLFKEFDWNVSGVDYDNEQVKYANHNLGKSINDQIIQHDLSKGLPSTLSGKFDVILCQNILYYIKRQNMINLLKSLRGFINKKYILFVSCRALGDWCFGKGSEIERNGFIIDRHETGEHGLLNIFYTPDEMKDMINLYIGESSDVVMLNTVYENIENEKLISNNDFILYGMFES